MKNALLIMAGLLIGMACILGADQFSSKSSGLTSIPEIESLQQVEDVLREHARAIDFIHRSLHADIDDINRDEIPDLQTQIDGIEIDFDIPLLGNCDFDWNAGTSKIDWTAADGVNPIIVYWRGTTYEISAGSSVTNASAVYWEEASPSAFSSTTSPGYDVNRWFMCFRRATYTYKVLQSPLIHGGLIQANTITADEIDVGDLFAESINLSGCLVGGGISGYDDDTPANNFFLGKGSGPYNCSFKVYNDATNYIKFDDQDGLRIAGDLAINGNCTFTAGYDPLDKVDETGGSYDTDGSNPRVRIFPDSSTGIIATDGGGNTVFEVLVGGADVGDVTIGDYAGNEGLLWDESAGNFTVMGDLVVEDGSSNEVFKAEASGANIGDVTIGNYAGGKGLKWDDSAETFNVRGDLVADDITTGILSVGGTEINIDDGTIIVDGGGDFEIGYLPASTDGSMIDCVGANPYYALWLMEDTISTSYYELAIGGVYTNNTPRPEILGFIRSGERPGQSSTYKTMQITPAMIKSKYLYAGNGAGFTGDWLLGISDTAGGYFGYDATRKITVNSSGVVTVPEECITGGTAGFTGSWVNNEGDTVTVVNGIITTVVSP